MEDGRPRASKSSAVGSLASFFSLPHQRGARTHVDPVLSGGPLQISPAQQMHVQVEH
jgi:hypothetical protein